MDKVSKKQNFTSKIYSIEKINPFFSKVKIYVLYEGFNRNGSYLTRDSILKAIPTVYNIPIVGEFLEEKRNFSGHGASIVKNENGEIEMIVTTRPYGVVPESAQIYWEEVTEDDGTARDYLVVDGAYLWTGRYPELTAIMDEGYFGQSMEIEVVNGNFAVIDGQEVFNVQEFIFSAFCLLGIDKESDEYGHVEPCFENSKVVTYSLDKEAFKAQFNQMIEELKFTLKEGGNERMEKTEKRFTEGTDTTEEVRKRLEVSANEEETEVKEETTETDVEIVPQKEIVEKEDALGTVEPAQDAPIEQINKPPEEEETTATEEPDGVEEDAETIVEDVQTDGDDSADSGESTDGGESTFTVDAKEYEALKADFAELKKEIQELRSYKRNRELSDLKEMFSHQVSEQEFKSIVETQPDASIEHLELAIYALIGKKNYSLDNKQKQNKVAVVSPKVANEEANPYGDIFN